jgi:hypothetical protein
MRGRNSSADPGARTAGATAQRLAPHPAVLAKAFTANERTVKSPRGEVLCLRSLKPCFVSLIRRIVWLATRLGKARLATLTLW